MGLSTQEDSECAEAIRVVASSLGALKIGTRCPACDFLNHLDAVTSDMPDGPVYCNSCGRTYYPASLANPRAFLESSRIVWCRDWDALAVGALIGFAADVLAEWLF